jgi:hypothetical protein
LNDQAFRFPRFSRAGTFGSLPSAIQRQPQRYINDENRLLRLNHVKPKLSLANVANAMTTNAATDAAANKATSAPPGRKVPQVQAPALSTRFWN